MLIFEHIPKTGGSTFHSSYLPHAFSQDEVCVLLDHDGGAEHEQFRQMTRQERRRFRIASGHQMEFAREIEPSATFISIARNPVKRVTSAYLHMLYHPAMQAWRHRVGSLPRLAEFADDDQLCFRNLQSMVLLGTRDPSLSDKQIEEQIANRYAVVGVTEEYNRLIFYLHCGLGLPLCLFNKQMVRHERSSLQLDPLEAQIISDRNSMDERVYRIVKQLFDTRFNVLLTPSDMEIFDIYERCLDYFRILSCSDPSQNICLTKSRISLTDIRKYCNLLTELSIAEAYHSDHSGSAIQSYPVSSLSSYNGQLEVRGDVAIVTTDSRPWTFSAYANFELPGVETSPRAVKICATVESGLLGVGWFQQDGATWLTRVLINSKVERTLAYLFIPKGTVGGRLVFRNGSQSGATRAAIHSIEVF